MTYRNKADRNMSSNSAVMPTYARIDLAFERGEGAWLVADNGRRYLDFGSGIAVTALGHAHPRLVRALTDQAGKLWHCSNLYRIPDQQRLGERLVDNSFADSAFFCNSGAEAVEACLKLARRYQHTVAGAPEKYRTIVTRGAFHGRTMATIAAGGGEKHTKGFEPLVDGFDRVPFGNLNEARAAVTAETAAILVEPVQGEGGINPAPEGFLKGLRAMADEYGLVLIFDEVQTGMGRTGKLFAYEWTDIVPDVMALAKGLGGGFPVGACLARAPFTEALTAGSHGTTFGGNPLAMAVANAVLDEMLDPAFLPHVVETGQSLHRAMADLAARYPTVLADVRGQGLLLGLVCAAPNTEVLAAFQAQGLLAAPAANNVIRLLPPLVIGEEEVAAARDMAEAACKVIAANQTNTEAAAQ